MKNTHIILTAVAMACVIGATAVWSVSDSTPNVVATEKETAIEKQPLTGTKSAVSTEPIEKVVKKDVKKDAGKPVYFVRESVHTEDAFAPEEIESLQSETPSKKGVEPIGAFRMKSGTIKNIVIGDKLTLPETGNTTYEVKVTEKTKNPDGSYTSRASIEGEDPKYYSIMTEGERNTFITLNSPEGLYQIEVSDGNGYVYNTQDIGDAYIDYSKTDALVPNGSEGHAH